jgi:nucleoside-diphosphate-sugar epimerase
MILLLGGTGFLGSHILEELIANNYKVVTTVRDSSSLKKIEHIDKASYSIFNISQKSISKIFEENDVHIIINAAVSYGRSSSAIEVIEANLLFPIQLIEEGLKRNLVGFINTNSYFNKDNLSYSHLLHYAVSKKSLLTWLKFFSTNLKIVDLMLEHIYGPRDSVEKFTAKIIDEIAIRKIKSIDLTHGHQMRDFTYVKDAANAYIYALKMIEANNFRLRQYQIGTGKAIQIKEFSEAVKEISKSGTLLKFGKIPYRIDEIMSSFADTSEIMNTGWKPRYSLRDGIAETIASEQNIC